MASVKLEHIYKVYPNGTKAVNDISLDIKNGEFVVFVGPSGCGKSTTLRMIAGLEEITAGELYIDNQIVNDVEPKDRDIAMVFQNYALYPHMTVYENMAFGLRLRHVPDDIIQEKVLWASEILGIKEYLDRKPRAMSGGQRQRVALGRAILRDPKVMLLDEPLSNLDAKLRTQMRTEIAKLHQKLKTTFIYVTHDQVEAMTLGDRVVVMKNGRIQQVDTPKNLYDHPSNIFVAGFIGTPQMNFFNCHLKRNNEVVEISLDDSNTKLEVPYNNLIKVTNEYLDGKHDIILGIRCEHISFTTKDDPLGIEITINHFEELGSECLVYGTLGTSDGEVTSDSKQIIVQTTSTDNLKDTKTAYVRFDLERTYFFDKESEETITPRIPKVNYFDAEIKDNNLVFLGVSLPLPETLKHEDTTGVQLQIPSDIFFKDDRNGFSVSVVNVEHINDKKLYHLKLNNRIFFALFDEDYNIGDEIKVSFDYSNITLKKDDEVIISTLTKFDEVKASFYNYQTVMAKGDYPAFKQLRDDKIKAASDYMDAKLMLEDNEYEKNISKVSILTEEEKEKLKEDTLSFIRKNNEEIASIKKENKSSLKEKKEEFTSKKKQIKEENDALFKKKKEDEINDFKRFKSETTDKDSLKRRSDEYHIFMDNFQTDKDNTLNLAINNLVMSYESDVASLKASTRRQTSLLKKNNSEKKKELKRLIDGKKYYEKEHLVKRKDLLNEKKNAIEKASLVFFFRFADDYYALLSDIISNKLIQGLGTRVFDKEFKIEIPHDAYTLTDDNNSLKGKVIGHLDYKFVCYNQVKLSNLDATIYVKSDKLLPLDSEVRLNVDVSRIQITETGMNIRLY